MRIFNTNKNFLNATFVSLFFWFSFGLRGPVVPLYIRSFGASMVEMGLVSVFGSVGWAVFEPSLGLLSDRIGRKKILQLSILGSALVTFLYTLARATWNFYFLSFFLSASMSGMVVTTRAFIADSLPSSKRGRSYGVFMTIISLCNIPAPFIGGYIAGEISYYLTFYLGVLILIFTFLIAYRIPEKEPQHNNQTTEPLKHHIPKFKGLQYFATIGFSFFFLTRMFQTFTGFFSTSILPVYVKESPIFSATEAQIGIMFGLASLISSPMQLVFGALSDKIGRKPMILIGLILSGLTSLGYLVVGDILQLYILQILVSLTAVPYQLGMMVFMIETIPSEYYGTTMGLYGLAEDFGGMAGSLTLGNLYDTHGIIASTYCIVIIYIIDSVLALASFKRFLRKL